MKRILSVLLTGLLAASMFAMVGCTQKEPPAPPPGPEEQGPDVQAPGVPGPFQNEATVIIDGQPVFINFDYNLPDESYTFRTPFKFDSAQGIDHNVVIYADTILYDVSIVAVSGADPYVFEETLFSQPELKADEFLTISTVVPTGGPVEAIIFKDSAGVQHYYLLIVDEVNGTICTSEFFPVE